MRGKYHLKAVRTMLRDRTAAKVRVAIKKWKKHTFPVPDKDIGYHYCVTPGITWVSVNGGEWERQ